MSDERPSPIPKVIRRWWSLPVFLAVIGYEFYMSDQRGVSPDWFWLSLAGAGLVFLVLVNLGNMRR